MAEPEAWLRGPVAGVPPLLMPAAHALQQCRGEVRAVLEGLTPEQVGHRPAGAASVEFHVRHAIGSLDRLLTYARGESLDDRQRDALAGEHTPSGLGPGELTALFDEAVERALAQLRATDESTVLEARFVGRARLPSNVLGLLFHAAEHTQRHVGQLTTTARIVRTLPAL